jgi:hypothetical protein
MLVFFEAENGCVVVFVDLRGAREQVHRSIGSSCGTCSCLQVDASLSWKLAAKAHKEAGDVAGVQHPHGRLPLTVDDAVSIRIRLSKFSCEGRRPPFSDLLLASLAIDPRGSP